MKKLITIALLISSLSTMAQSNKRYQNGLTFLTNPPISKMDTISTYWNTTNIISNNFSIAPSQFTPGSIFFTNDSDGKQLVKITFKKDGKSVGFGQDWDVMEIHLSKKQFYWLNDSTAIFIKPNK